jgi:DNA-directed RNA polymerase subunit RPC12/RpoP
MPSISSCPACHRDLTIPDLADRQQPLRCPLCDAQFAAEAVLADCVNFPPAAIVVGAAESPIAAATNSVEPAPQLAFDNEPIAGISDDLSWPLVASSAPAATESESAALEEPAAMTEPSLGDEVRASSIASPAPQADESLADVGEPVAASDSANEEAATDYQAFDQQVASMRVSPKARRQASPLGALGQLLGMALGGVLGLAIGYYVLLWIGGPSADFLKVRNKVPRWLLPPARRHNAAGDAVPLSSPRGGRSDQPSRTLADLVAEPDSFDAEVIASDSATGDDLGLSDNLVTAEAREAGAPPEEPQFTPSDHFVAASKPLPEGYRGPRGFKLRTAAELKAALDQADRALRCPHCQRPGAVRLAAFDAPLEGSDDGGTERRCDYCRGKLVLNVTTAAFEEVCNLGEAVTFVQFEAHDPGRSNLRDAAETILMAIGSQRDKSEVVGRLAGARLDDGRRQTNGIVVAGTVQLARPEGEFFAIQLMLFGCGKSVTIVSRRPPEPPVARRDRLVVLGSIVDSPVENLVGYTGDLPQIIWGGLQLRLTAPAQ